MLKSKDLIGLLKDAVVAGVDKAMTSAIVLPDQLTKAEAFRIYGRSNVERWLLEGLLTPIQKNGLIQKKCIDRNKLEAVAAASNRITYLPVAER